MQLPTPTKLYARIREVADRGLAELADYRLAATVVRIARDDIGRGESGGRNKGPDLERYGVGDGESWCAAAAWSWYAWAHDELYREYPVEYTMGAKQLYRRTIRAGAAVEPDAIRPGDLACWDRGDEGDWRGHVAIVSRVVEPGQWSAIHGNSGPKVVEREHVTAEEPRLIGFARLTVAG